MRLLIIQQPPNLLAWPTCLLSCCPTQSAPMPPVAQNGPDVPVQAVAAMGETSVAQAKTTAFEGDQWCAHAESYCCYWPSALCPLPSLTPCPSQQLMMRTSERRASIPAVISVRMTQMADLCWKLEVGFLSILNICINTQIILKYAVLLA